MRFAISWNYPLGAIYWFDRAQPGDPEYAGEPPTWRNYYATQWTDSLASGAEALRRWDELEAETAAFRDSLFGSSTPPEIVDAVSGTLGVLRSATVIRLEGGELWGWEGQHIGEGSCEGSCTHVWNYQQALAWLFPALERTLARNGVHLQPAAERRPDLPPAAAARVGLRRDRALRRRTFRRDDQGLSRVAELRRRRLAQALLAEHPALDRLRLVAGKSGPLGPGQDRRALGPPAPYARHGVVRPEFLAHQHVSCGAQGGRRDGATRWAKRISQRNARRWPRRAAPMSTASFSTGATTRRNSSSTNDRRWSRSIEGRKAGVLRDSFMQAYWSEEYGRSNIRSAAAA